MWLGECMRLELICGQSIVSKKYATASTHPREFETSHAKEIQHKLIGRAV